MFSVFKIFLENVIEAGKHPQQDEQLMLKYQHLVEENMLRSKEIQDQKKPKQRGKKQSKVFN